MNDFIAAPSASGKSCSQGEKVGLAWRASGCRLLALIRAITAPASIITVKRLASLLSDIFTPHGRHLKIIQSKKSLTLMILSPGVSPWTAAGLPGWTAVTKIPTSLPPVRRMPTLPSFLKLINLGSGLQYRGHKSSKPHLKCSSSHHISNFILTDCPWILMLWD